MAVPKIQPPIREVPSADRYRNKRVIGERRRSREVTDVGYERTNDLQPLLFAGISVARERIAGRAGWIVNGPIMAGDLEPVAPGRVVAIVDGTLEPDKVVSAVEIRAALRRGVEVHGAASVGALRAAELAGDGMLGHGWVYGAFRRRVIEGADEIAVLYDPYSGHPLTVPLVGVRFCIQELSNGGRIGRAAAAEAMAAIKSLPLERRDPGNLFRRVRECLGADLTRACLASFPAGRPDVKARDGWELVHEIERRRRCCRSAESADPNRHTCNQRME